jgi:SAM-dependent MidA family methyltransferase
MAADLLRSLPPDGLPARYRILERSADLRQVQHDRILSAAPELADRVEWLDRPPTADWQGVVLANEVLDALTVERFRVSDDGVEQICVALKDGRFCWSNRPAPKELQQAVEHVMTSSGIEFAPGYRSEINLHLADWLDAVTCRMKQGLALFIDYGYPRREYYRAERSDGTLMCHYRHRAHDDVFFWPGLQDITAWVDFTALAEAADFHGLDVEGYASQSFFLLGCGLGRILEEHHQSEGDDALEMNAQARQLTLPGMMGEKFQVMGLGRGLVAPVQGFSLQDLRYRL